ncbi:MAG: biopolymer transporter ExbD [Spirochaetaceae bacterium]|nr:biopolymer transporter ExbD [Spirochaetaceae bacterium]
MRAIENRRHRRRSGGLLLTPLIDIIFLLCLFFVLNTSFRQERYLDVNLPESETSKDVQAVGIVLTLRQDGSTAIDGVEVAWESVTAALRERAEEIGAVEVIIRGDEAVSYGRAVAALDRVRLSGLESISLQTVRTGE